MGVSRRAATTRQNLYSMTRRLSPEDDDDKNDPLRNNYSSQPTASPTTTTIQRYSSPCSSSHGGVLSKFCLVLLLTATAAIRWYSVLLSTRSVLQTVVVDHGQTLVDSSSRRHHVTTSTQRVSGNGKTLAVSESTHEQGQGPSVPSAATTPLSTMTTIPRRLVFTHQRHLLDPDQQQRISMHEMRFQQNILHTIEQYQSAWKAMDAEQSNVHSSPTTANSNRTGNSNTAIVQVWFLDNNDCEAAIEQVEPDLVPHFRNEPRGDYKADLCRIAALYLYGGYYFDVDMRVIQPIILEKCSRSGDREEANSNDITFATAVMAARDGFFQSFLASTASNPILRGSLNIMLEWYKHKAVLKASRIAAEEDIPRLLDEPSAARNNDSASIKDERQVRNGRIYGNDIDPALWAIDGRGLIGPVSLKFAYERVMMVNGSSSSHSFGEGSSLTLLGTTTTGGKNQNAFILQEDDLSANPNRELFPDLVRQEGDGCCCNYVVHGPPTSLFSRSSVGDHGPSRHPKNASTGSTTTVPYFFSRIVGAGEYCGWKGGVGAWVRPRQKQYPTYALFKPF